MKFPLLTGILLLCLIQVANSQTFTGEPISISPGPDDTSTYEWIDLDKDNDLDLISKSAAHLLDEYFHVYRNDNGVFTEVDIDLSSSNFDKSYGYGDYDHDGDIDILIADPGVRIAINNGDLTFTIQNKNLSNGGFAPSIAYWKDLDGDSDLDILLDNVIYINTDGVYTKSPIELPVLRKHSWADVNNDGLIDFVALKGTNYSENPLLLYLNLGDGLFTEIGPVVGGVKDDVITRWMDADGDNLLDLVVTEPNGAISLFRNTTLANNQPVFERQWSITYFENLMMEVGDIDVDGLPDMIINYYEGWPNYRNTYLLRNTSVGGAISFNKIDLKIYSYRTTRFDLVNIDGDDDLDIFMEGTQDDDFSSRFRRVFKNNLTNASPIPLVPNSLTFIMGETTALSWNHDDGGKACYYNVELKRNGLLYKSSLTSVNGSILMPEGFELNPSKAFAIAGLPAGTYEWKVQAVDHAYRTSAFSATHTFEMLSGPTNLQLERVTFNAVKLDWSYSGSNHTGFTIFRRSDKQALTSVGNVSPMTTTFVDENNAANQHFEYFVRAVIDNSFSTNSNIVKYYSAQFVSSGFSPNIVQGRSVSADFDLDGDYDIGFIGTVDGSGGKSGMLLNDGTGTYTYSSSFLPETTLSFASITGRDIDNDGDTDICALVSNQSFLQLIIFKNNNNTFTKAFETPFYVAIPQFTIEDFNQDGRPDILFSHTTSNSFYGPKSYQLLYQAQDESFVNSGEDFLPTSKLYAGTFIISDLNGDSFRDIVFSGNDDVKARIFRNVSGNGFSEVPTSLPILYAPNFKDFTGDGQVDLITGSYPISFYTGTGDFQFGARQVIPVEMNVSSFLNADMNLDGVSDVIMRNGNLIRLFTNDGTGALTESGFQFDSNQHNILTLTDMENDGDLDLIKFGLDPGKNFFYKNQTSNVLHQNARPSAPASFQGSISINGIAFSWLPSTDDRTAGKSISYNLSVTDSHGKIWLHSETNAAGTFLNRLSPGNVGYTNSYTLNNALPAGVYTAKVQAIDASFASSSWSTANFTVLEGPSGLSIERVLLNKVQLHWTNGPALATKILVVRKSAGTEFEVIAEVPAGTVSYTDANLAYENTYTYKIIEVIGEDLTVGSNQESWNTTLLTLADVDFPDFSGTIDVGDYTGDGKMDIAIADLQTSAAFENSASGWINLPVGIPGNSALKFEDINGDFKLDLYRVQKNAHYDPPNVETFLNNGDKTFTSQSNLFTQNHYNLIDWWDYDMDNDLDANIQREFYPGSYGHSILKNLSGGSFETGIVLCPGCNPLYYLYGDFDKDGDEDRVEKYGNGYRVNLNGFKGLKPSATIEPNYPVLRWHALDYNGDGWLDILLLSSVNNQTRSMLYKNEGFDQQGELNFQLVKDNFPSGDDLFVNWIDYDHDGDLDLFFMGFESSIQVNNGASGFQQLNLPPLGWGFKPSQWIDIDNDGDHDLVVPGVNMNRSIFVNNLIQATKGEHNEPPSPPTNLQALSDSTGVYLQWVAGVDDHTSAEAQTFDIVLFKDGQTITKGLINPETGMRLKLQPGRNFGTAYLKGLAPGAYEWKVQAIDQSYAGSAFSEQGSFTFKPLQPIITNDTTFYYCAYLPVLKAKGENIEWFSDKETTVKIADGDFHPDKSQVVYVTQTVNGFKSYSTRVNIKLIYRFPSKPVLLNTNPLAYCEYEAGFYGTAHAEGDGIRWYADAAKTIFLGGGNELSILATPKSYYVTQSKDGCESEPEKLVVYEEIIDSGVRLQDGKLVNLEQNGDYYEWFLDGRSIPNSNNNSIELELSGSYVLGIIKGYCYEFSEPFIITGTEEQSEENELQIFPNPTSDNFTIELPAWKEGEITILDVSGRVVYTKSITESSAFDTHVIPSVTWKAGIYLITITSGQKKLTRKIIKL